MHIVVGALYFIYYYTVLTLRLFAISSFAAVTIVDFILAFALHLISFEIFQWLPYILGLSNIWIFLGFWIFGILRLMQLDKACWFGVADGKLRKLKVAEGRIFFPLTLCMSHRIVGEILLRYNSMYKWCNCEQLYIGFPTSSVKIFFYAYINYIYI